MQKNGKYKKKKIKKNKKKKKKIKILNGIKVELFSIRGYIFTLGFLSFTLD